MPVAPPTCCTICNRRRCGCEKPKPPARASSHARGYGRRWQKLRKRFLLHHPLCNHCSSSDHPVTATQVDHIQPHRGDYKLLNDWNNLQSLCHSCHSKKTARERRASPNRVNQNHQTGDQTTQTGEGGPFFGGAGV